MVICSNTANVHSIGLIVNTVRRYIVENEQNATEQSGAKQLRDALHRSEKKTKELQAELEIFKSEKMDNVIKEIGLDATQGFGKALSQVYEGKVDAESISEFAKTEYGYESNVQAGEPQPATTEVQSDARARVQALEDSSSSTSATVDVFDELKNIQENGSVRDSLRAKLGVIDQAKENTKK